VLQDVSLICAAEHSAVGLLVTAVESTDDACEGAFAGLDVLQNVSLINAGELSFLLLVFW
jgi:hypothetical protein